LNLTRRFAKLRASEWVLVTYFAYVALISPFFPDRPHLKFQPVFALLAAFLLLSLLALYEQQSRFAFAISHVRDWLPILLTLAAFREMELFLPARYDLSYENTWAAQDHVLLATWHVRAFIESLSKLIPFYLELCYLLVYGLPAYCVAVLYSRHKRLSIDRFLLVYLAGTLAAYALFPYFPTQPPRLAFPGIDEPSAATWVRHLNLYVLSKATIHSGVFPSAHVSSAFSAAWAMFLVLPKPKVFGFALLVYAISVSIATVYGRYHYSADVLSGFALSLLAGVLCLYLHSRSSGSRQLPTLLSPAPTS